MVRWTSGSPSAGVTVRISALCVLAVWILVSIGGAANPGFKQYEQYLSTLSAQGAFAPQWGRAAMVVAALGIVVVVPALWSWRRGVGGAALLAAMAAVAIVATPLPCPPGQRFCSASTDTPVPAELHASAVLVFCVAVLTVISAAAIQIAAGAQRRPHLWPAPLVACALTAAAAAPLLHLSGLPQRTLLLAAQVAIVLRPAFAHGELRRRDREQLRLGLAHHPPLSTLSRFPQLSSKSDMWPEAASDNGRMLT